MGWFTNSVVLMKQPIQQTQTPNGNMEHNQSSVRLTPPIGENGNHGADAQEELQIGKFEPISVFSQFKIFEPI